MAYRILYDGKAKQNRSGRGILRLVLTVCSFLCFLQMVSAFWPEGRELLEKLLISGKSKTMLDAAEVFAQELNSGFSLTDAARNFCIAVMEHAY